ncbi:MAG: Hpt domain-containing protein [Pseudomonadota bacterium]
MVDQDSDLSFLRASPIGDDPQLLAELHGALAESVERQIDLLSRARCDGNWHIAAARLEGLAASFGVGQLAELAEEAACAAPGDPVVIAALRDYYQGLVASLSN